jgi:hypothetical protein
MTTSGDMGTEIAPEVADDPQLAARLDDLLHRACSLARALTDAEQAALSVDLDGDRNATRKFFNMSAPYARRRDFRVDPGGRGLHGIRLQPSEGVRLTQDEVESHPDFDGFGHVADSHPPMRGRLSTPVCSEDGRSYGEPTSPPRTKTASASSPELKSRWPDVRYVYLTAVPAHR